MIHTYNNINYDSGECCLVKCKECNTIMALPNNYSICPECGKSGSLMGIGQNAILDEGGWENPIIECKAKFIDNGQERD